MADNIASGDMSGQAVYRRWPMNTRIALRDNGFMAKKRIYFREWRKHRGLTQEQAAGRLDVSQGHLSDLETGKKSWTQPVVEAMTDAYSCELWELFGRNPLLPPAEVTHMIDVRRVPEAQRPVIVQLVQSLEQKTA
jgi:transcriptional regulator with XRE-family HTH domain